MEKMSSADVDSSYADPILYINRELSWIEFNRRVLDEAQDRSVPLLERLKFVAIFGSNFDEFFMVRVGNLKEKIAQGISATSGADHMSPREQLNRINQLAHDLYLRAYACLDDEIIPALTEAGIHILDATELTEEEADFIDGLFRREIFLVLTPLAVDPSHPFPHLLHKSLNLAIRVKRPQDKHVHLAFVQVPGVLDRFVVLPGRAGGHRLFPLEEIIRRHLKAIFPGMTIVDSCLFRITRDSDLDLDDYEEIKDLAETIARQVRERRHGVATRLEIELGAPGEIVEGLRDALDLEPGDIYELPHPLDLTSLFQVCGLPGYRNLRYPEFVPRIETSLQNSANIFKSIRQGDILLHHPYDSFKPVVDFISNAADDPGVLAIKQTLYRTSSDSPIVRALQRAAENGKQVTALVELQARLDEEKNIAWARALERSGVHVIFGFVDVKTHAKVALVVRREEDGFRRYVHLATGNYNPDTARVYTDLGLLTCDPVFAEDAGLLFNYLTGFSDLPEWKRIKVAPSGLLPFFLDKIQHEASLGSAGRIVAKVNGILEPSIIRALYAASQAGCKIDLLCRGICALRPGLKGVSPTIRVVSVVDRFLEHSRAYYFGGGGKAEVYVGSADWMDRNLRRRIEIVFPICDDRLRARVMHILAVCLHDDTKARQLNAEGMWRRVEGRVGGASIRSQRYFLQNGDVPPTLRKKKNFTLEDFEDLILQAESTTNTPPADQETSLHV